MTTDSWLLELLCNPFDHVIAGSYKRAPLTTVSQRCMFATFATRVFLLKEVWKDIKNPFIVNRPVFPSSMPLTVLQERRAT